MPKIEGEDLKNLQDAATHSSGGYDITKYSGGFKRLVPPYSNPTTGAQASFIYRDETEVLYNGVRYKGVVHIRLAGTNFFKGDPDSKLEKDSWFGLTDVAKGWTTTGKLQYDALNQDILNKVILDAQKDGYKVVVYGDSLGGMVAQRTQLDYPDVEIRISNTGNICFHWMVQSRSTRVILLSLMETLYQGS